MQHPKHALSRSKSHFRVGVVAAMSATVSIAMLLAFPGSAEAAPEYVSLGSAASFAVLAGTGITNTGTTTINGNIGSYPTGSETGFSTLVLSGTNYPADTTSQAAQSSLVTAYNYAAAEGPQIAIANGTLGVETLTPGVYNSGSTIQLNGPLTLNGNNNPNSVFVFQAGSGLTSASASDIVLENGAQACNVFWQVGSSATLGSGSSFQGTILASTSITVGSTAVVAGRLLANTGDVTLDANTVTVPTCNNTSTVTTTAPSNTLPTLGNSVNDVATVTGNSTNGTPSGTVQFYECGPGSTSCSSSTGTALSPSETLSGGVATSPNFSAGAIGTYCFATVYTPASGSPYTSSSVTGDTTNGECFTVASAPGIVPTVTPPPTVTTSAPSNTLPTLGNSVHDVATVAGNSTNGTPTGTVQFYECGPGSILCSSTTGTALSPSQTLNGGVATSPNFTAGAIGTYCFASVYTPASGSPYVGSSEAGSTSNGECFTVASAPGVVPAVTPPPTVTTSAASNTQPTLGNSVHDVATVAGNSTNGTPSGTVQFYECGPGAILCSSTTGTALSPSETLNGGVATSPNFTPGAIGTYCFASVYTPAVGSPYVGSSEAGSTTNGECFTVSNASTIVVPPAHTGEPWSGWPWWVGTALLGIGGVVLIAPRKNKRNLHHQR